MLIGKKVCLGPMLQGDEPILFNWFNTLGLTYSNGPYRPYDQPKFNEWFAGVGADPTRVVFSIRQYGDLRLLGYVQIVNIQSVPRTADIGILIGNKSDQGQGFGQEAMGMAVEFCWRDLNLQRLALNVIGPNPRAVHTYQKVGFAVEGTLRQAAYVNGQYLDITAMGILRPRSESEG
jgi:RimJ/RimL family protein N-acetyltransferase